MSERTCAWAEEHLPLLRYDGELTPEQSAELAAHLAGCVLCQQTRDALEASADALDEIAVEQPDSERAAALKDRVLVAVDAASDCPRELEMLDGPDSEHLASCATCRELLGVGGALDLVSAPALGAEQRAALTERILTTTGVLATCPREVDVLSDLAAHQTHLVECASCAESHTDFLGVGRALDRVAAPELSAVAKIDLKARILAAVDAAPVCSREDEVLAGAADPEHLSACAPCRELSLVGAALDTVPLPAPSAERMADLLSRVQADVAEPVEIDAPVRGRVIPFPFRLARAAAAVLLAGMVGFFGAEALKTDGGASALASIRHEQEVAEELARSGEPRLAEAQYARVLRKAEQRADDPRFASLAVNARYQRQALGAVTRRALAGAKDPSQTPFPEEILITNRDVIVEFPDSLASLYLVKQYGRALRFSSEATPNLEEIRPASPYPRHELIKFDYAQLRQVIPVTITDHRIRQTILLQQGLHAEKVGDLLEARLLYRRAVELGADSKAGQLALERLTQLG